MAKIEAERSAEMFEIAGIHRQAFMNALVSMGPDNLKTAAMRREWSTDNPTKNYCYVVTEWLKFYYFPDSPAFKLNVPGYDSFGTIEGAPVLHYFLVKEEDGRELLPIQQCTVLDLAAEQFDNYDWVREHYHEGEYVKSFMFTPTKRAKLLQEYYMEELQQLDTHLYAETFIRLNK